MTYRKRHFLLRRLALTVAVAGLAAPAASAGLDAGLGAPAPASPAPRYGMPRALPSDFQPTAAIQIRGGRNADGYLPRSAPAPEGPTLVRQTPDGFQPQLHNPRAVPVSDPGSGFDWGDAGIGFGAALALALLAGGMAIGLRDRGRLATG